MVLPKANKFSIIRKEKEWHQNSIKIASKYIEFHYIELPKYKKKEPAKFTKLDQWMCIFTQNEEGIDMAERENKEIKKAMNTLDFISADPKERERHNSIIMAEYNRLTSEHNFFEAGKKERKRRTEKRNGKIEGAKEKSIQIAKEMINKELSIDLICEITKLTKEEVNQIIKKN